MKNSRAGGGPRTLTPVGFNGCFGWFHWPRESKRSDVAVLICQGILREASLAYSATRQFGADLAATGYPTLRFDYPAAGNSLDGDLNQSGMHWTAWRNSVDGAVDWLRAVTGAKRVVLCGLVTGGALATLVAAARRDIAGLLLIEPMIVGRSHIRQLILEGNLQHDDSTPHEQGLEIREMRFGGLTVAQIAGTDLRELILPTGLKTAIFAGADSTAADDCVRAWSDRGVDVSRHGFDGMQTLLEPARRDEIPLADFAPAIAWLSQTVPPEPAPGEPVNLPVFVLQPPGCIDTPLRFGPENRLFGVLCRPDRGNSDDIVLIPSGGREPSFGAARRNVVLARRLAEAGVASFRFDFAGIGDSIGPPGRERVFSHALTDRTGDVRAAIDTLAELGFSRFSAHGHCLGAYHALRAGAVEPRLSALILTNLPLFTAPAFQALGQLEQRGRSVGHYLAKLLRPSSWVHRLRDRSTLTAFKRAATFHLHDKTIGLLDRLTQRVGLRAQRSFAHNAMATLSRRGTRTLYLFSTKPQHIEAFAAEFGADGSGLAAYPGASMRVVPAMDRSHTLTAHRAPADMAVEFLLADRLEAAE